MRGTHGRWSRVAAVPALVATLVTAMGGVAEAGTGTTVVPIRSHASSGTVGAADLDCPEPPAGGSVVALTGTTVIGVRAGDTLVGEDVWTGCFTLLEDGTAQARGVALFNGTIAGCGTGTIEISFRNTFSAPDPVTGTRQATGVDSFVPDSGTGGLSGVRGGVYRTTTTIQPDQTFTDGFGKGFAVCRPS